MNLDINNRALRNLNKINVILGKNGCGKSTILRHFDQHYRNSEYSRAAFIKYLSPERGGQLKSDTGIENRMLEGTSWQADTRRKNRVENFRQMTAAEFRHLETLVLRKIENDRAAKDDFNAIVDSINGLLDKVKLV